MILKGELALPASYVGYQ